MKVARWQLDQRQGQPLEIKIQMSKARIRQWYEHWDGEVFVAFSGGLDSTVLLHLIRSIYPNTSAVFHNTGLEFPEIVKFVKETDNVHWTQPKKRFPQVIEEYGWPVVSKRISRYIHDAMTLEPTSKTAHLRLTGYTSKGDYRPSYMISKKWRFLIDAPFPISHRCCDFLKKNPAKEAEKLYGAPYLGMTTEEGDQRAQTYLRYGCNIYDSKRPRSFTKSIPLVADHCILEASRCSGLYRAVWRPLLNHLRHGIHSNWMLRLSLRRTSRRSS